MHFTSLQSPFKAVNYLILYLKGIVFFINDVHHEAFTRRVLVEHVRVDVRQKHRKTGKQAGNQAEGETHIHTHAHG